MAPERQAGPRVTLPSAFQREAGDVVELGRAARKRSDRRLDALHPLGRVRAVSLFGQQTLEAILPELVRLRVLGLGDPVGLEEEEIAWTQLSVADRHLHGLEQADRQAADTQRLHHAAPAPDKPREMAAVAIFEHARARIVCGV